MQGQGRDFHAIKWVDENTATRFTHEVDLKCEIIKEPGKVGIRLVGVADCEHHLVEDSAILLKKIAEIKCGGGH